MDIPKEFSDLRKALQYIRSGKCNYALQPNFSYNNYEYYFCCFKYGTHLRRRCCGTFILNNNSLENIPSGFNIPKDIEEIYLSSLTSAKGLNLPEGVKKVWLPSLASAEGLKLPKDVAAVDLSSITSAKGFKLPKGVKYVNLSFLTSTEGLEKQKVWRFLKDVCSDH